MPGLAGPGKGGASRPPDEPQARRDAELLRFRQDAGCRLLLDLNNVRVSAHNLGTTPADYLRDFPLHAVVELHLAGYSADPRLGDALWIERASGPGKED